MVNRNQAAAIVLKDFRTGKLGAITLILSPGVMLPVWTMENKLREHGFSRIVGIDEAGRGPLAGPVVAAAVQVIPESFSAEVRDSKRLAPRKREQAYEEIFRTCQVGVGLATVEEIDELNILQATFLAMKRAIGALSTAPDICLVDGPLDIPGLPWPQRRLSRATICPYPLPRRALWPK